jgi:hypothetical protein
MSERGGAENIKTERSSIQQAGVYRLKISPNWLLCLYGRVAAAERNMFAESATGEMTRSAFPRARKGFLEEVAMSLLEITLISSQSNATCSHVPINRIYLPICTLVITLAISPAKSIARAR